MLAQPHRLRHWQDFKTVYKHGTRCNGRNLSLRALRRPPNSPSGSPNSPTRFGISISLKVSKKAIVRNRIKRQIRAALRQLLPRISPGWDCVIVVRPSAIGCNYDRFLQELEQLLAKNEVLHGHPRGNLL